MIRRWVRNNGTVLAIWAIVITMVGGAAIYSPTFRSSQNIFQALRQAVFLGIVSIGQTFAMIAGGIDLSVGSTVKLVTVIAGGTMQGREELALPVVVLCLLIGTTIGMVNGLVVTKLRVAPFIATLGMYSIVRGLALGYTTTPVGSIARSVRPLYSAYIGPIPLPVIISFALFIIGSVVLNRTVFGLHVRAVGGSGAVARLSGIKVARVRIAVFVISGFLASVTGLILVCRLGVGDPSVGQGLELDSIAATVLGGTSLFGGRGTLLGTLAGVLVLAFIGNIFNLLAINTYYQQLLKGLLILLAVSIWKQSR